VNSIHPFILGLDYPWDLASWYKSGNAFIWQWPELSVWGSTCGLTNSTESKFCLFRSLVLNSSSSNKGLIFREYLGFHGKNGPALFSTGHRTLLDGECSDPLKEVLLTLYSTLRAQTSVSKFPDRQCEFFGAGLIS